MAVLGKNFYKSKMSQSEFSKKYEIPADKKQNHVNSIFALKVHMYLKNG